MPFLASQRTDQDVVSTSFSPLRKLRVRVRFIGGWNLSYYLWTLPTAEAYLLIRLCFSLLNRVTETGGAYDEAMEHLYNLQLRDKIKSSGAKDMGDAIRNYLRRVYRVDEIGFDRV